MMGTGIGAILLLMEQQKREQEEKQEKEGLKKITARIYTAEQTRPDNPDCILVQPNKD
jgi:N-dimethylarginine dimethylaminohydrolase